MQINNEELYLAGHAMERDAMELLRLAKSRKLIGPENLDRRRELHRQAAKQQELAWRLFWYINRASGKADDVPGVQRNGMGDGGMRHTLVPTHVASSNIWACDAS